MKINYQHSVYHAKTGTYIAKVDKIHFGGSKWQQTSYIIYKVIDEDAPWLLLQQGLLGKIEFNPQIDGYIDWYVCDDVTVWDKVLYYLGVKRNNLPVKASDYL